MRFCITGTGRSGTTLLRHLFNMHPEVFVYHESHWIPKMVEFFGSGEGDVHRLIAVVEKTFHVTGKPVTILDRARLDAALAGRDRMTVREFCDILGGCFAEAAGKRYWADKTPDYGPYLETLQRLWPQCRFVHVVRHGLETALSMSRHPGFRWMASAGEMWWVQPSYNKYFERHPTRDVPLEEFVALWYWRFQRIRDEASRLLPGSYLEVRFEDLIARPAELLKQVADHVGLAADPNWLACATPLVDPRRVQCDALAIVAPRLQPAQERLLAALGYQAAKRHPAATRTRIMRQPELQYVSGPVPAEGREGLSVFACIRNEALRLPYFLRHYRGQGAGTFYIVDNGSSDSSKDLLRREPDVVLYHAGGSYADSNCGMAWIHTLLDRYGHDRWCLIVDADELLVYPHCESLDLQDLTGFLESAGAHALLTFLIDMYASVPVREAGYQPGMPFLDTCRYFDADGYWSETPDASTRGVPSRGGPRQRVFWQDKERARPTPYLQKIPLVRWSRGLSYGASTHLLEGVAFAEVTGALLHFKFFSDFVQRVEEEVQRKEHFAGAFQYSVYAEELRRDPDLTLYHDKAVEYSDSRCLVKRKLIRSTPAFEACFKQKQA